MLSRNRFFTVLTVAGYLLAVSGSALFHHHSDDCGHDDEHSRPGVSSSHSDEGHDCLVCQFLAQKQAPVDVVTPIHSIALVQNIASPSLLSVIGEVFSAWQSRAPPAFA